MPCSWHCDGVCASLPFGPARCGPTPGCGQVVDAYGDHALACPRIARHGRKGVDAHTPRGIARPSASVGAEGQVVPQQWLAHTTATGVNPQDRRGLDLVVYGASPMGGALCCDATLVSPLTWTGQPQPCTEAVNGAMLP